MFTAQGIPVSNGVAIGPCWIYQPMLINIERCENVDPDQELIRLVGAIATARNQLTALHNRASVSLGKEEAAIFEAHLLFLVDPEFIGEIERLLRTEQINADAAVQETVEMFAAQMLALEDDYFRARAQDIRDVGRRILYCLNGILPEQLQQPDQPVVILADDLTPSDTIQFERQNILGLGTIHGGPTSHTAILARSLGVPAAVGLALDLNLLVNEAIVILDGGQGTLIGLPDSQALAEARQAQAAWELTWHEQLSSANQPAITRDGRLVEVVANIGSVEDARMAVQFGAEGVGLLRTEFLYLDAQQKPGEEEQVNAYQAIFKVMGERPVVVRTLDIGGDKPVNYLDLRVEANPFLGWRAIRMISERPEILLDQFCALLRAGAGYHLRIMLPMVSCLDEVQQARQIFDQAYHELHRRGLPAAENVQFGIMIEVPSAALIVEHLAKFVDFFSIGTNDLTQYTIAVDRTNERVSRLASPFHPAVLRLISRTITKAHEYGRWVGLCGEMAGDPSAAPLLLGLGLDEFSMAPASVPMIKQKLRSLDYRVCQEIAAVALEQPTTEAVKNYLAGVA